VRSRFAPTLSRAQRALLPRWYSSARWCGEVRIPASTKLTAQSAVVATAAEATAQPAGPPQSPTPSSSEAPPPPYSPLSPPLKPSAVRAPRMAREGGGKSFHGSGTLKSTMELENCNF